MIEVKLIQNYLIDRILEILHKETLDSYRIRNHNAFTSLCELRDTITRWNQNRVKNFDTVRILGIECMNLLKKDTVLSYSSYPKEEFTDELKEFLRRTDKFPDSIADGRILFCLNKCIDENHKDYLKKLHSAIIDKIDGCDSLDKSQLIPFLDEIDSMIMALCVQLVFSGYSKQHLYLQLKNASTDYTKFKHILGNLISLQKKYIIVVWKIRIAEDTKDVLGKIGFHSTVTLDAEIEAIINQRNGKFLKQMQSNFFFKDEIQALDNFSAMKVSRENLMKKFDAIHLGKHNCSLLVPPVALVCQESNGNWFVNQTASKYFLDGSFSDDFSSSINWNDCLDAIYKNSSIEYSVKDRLSSAIRHLNCGDTDTEIEQRFINYWIALEFIFSSPHTNENTYSRMKNHLINVLSCSYIKRNTDYLQEKVIESGFAETGANIFNSEETIDSILDNNTIPLVLSYKLRKTKSRLLNHTDKRKEYFQCHVTNLECHLTRIYNLRNALVHEGALNQDVENITSNLRYYLVFVIDQIIDYFQKVQIDDNHRNYILEDFFNEYTSLRKVIERDYKIEVLLSVPISHRLW